MLLIFLLVLFFKLPFGFNLNQQKYSTLFDDSKSVLAIKNFYSFSDIDLNYKVYIRSGQVLKIEYEPNKKLNLDSDLFFWIDFKNVTYKEIFKIHFSKIKSFNSTRSLFFQLSQNKNLVYLAFYHSILNYSLGCNDNQMEGMFRHVTSIIFAFSVKYLPNVCPYVFKNTDLISLEFHGITKSFLSFNQLDFDDTQDLGKLNSSAYFSLNFFFYKGILTKRMMIFRNATNLRINGMIDKIESESFSSTKIKAINFDIDNERFFFSHGIEWMSMLNSQLKINLSDLNETRKNFKNRIQIYFHSKKLLSIKKSYEFDDSDFCIFKNFPDDRFIFFDLKYLSSKNSCLKIWLMKKSCLVFNLLQIHTQMAKCGNITDLEKKIKQRNFKQRLNKCHLYKKQNFILTNSAIFYVSQIAEFFFQIISYFFVGISFVSNSLSLFILVKVVLFHCKNLDGIFFKIEASMLANCSLNLLYLLTRFIHLVKKCVYPNSVFCPGFYYSHQSQLVEMVFVDYLNVDCLSPSPSIGPVDLDFTTFSGSLFKCETSLFEKNTCLALMEPQNRF
ncbi:hypothetical protein BpHYR1_049926 [Brachionus plicatilis]|uniref:Uncharacterized protein n=1 Tax=Brachionus plicatilis TaxID=10195 RepID=A0A3M7S5R9_BRAPC|nr:hypothetical protein BpHYR1_049926 [Brachionus plicatilis]